MRRRRNGVKYDKIEKQKSKKRIEEDEVERLTDLYICAESMPEFELKCATAGLGRSGLIKWFKLFYLLKNNSVALDSFILWYIFIPGMFLSAVAIWLAIALIPMDAVGCCLKSVMVLFVAVTGITGAVMAARRIGHMLATVKDAVWKKE